MGLEVFHELRGAPPKIDRPPLTGRIAKIDADGIWAVPVGGDNRYPVGPCRGRGPFELGDICLIVWTQERPWVLS
ncbi:hypothetical protein GCM10028801_41310 [Nocardioides maradonensis]